MKILIVDNGTSYIKELLRLTKNHNSEVKNYEELLPVGHNQFDLIILSGGHSFPVMGNEDKLSKELELIRSTKTPILGICFGFELIASVYGAKLSRMQSKEKTILEIKKIEEDPIFGNLDNIKVFESHRWVVSEVGNDLISVASSKDGIEIIKHKSKLIYGFQFHPEMFEASTEGDELFANFVKLAVNQKKL